MKLTLLFFDVFGKNLVSLLLRLICFYYFIFAKSARKYSRLYSNNYISFCESKGVTPVHFSSFKHILAFSHMVLDKFLVWKNKISLDDFNQDDVRTLKELAHRPKGSLFISSHFGNIELIRSLGRKYPQIHYNALIYTKNSEKMFKILEEIDPNFKEKIIAVQSFGPEVGMVLEDKIKANEWVFCMGDRLSASSEKNLKLNLLGKEAELPLGPFLMSYLLDAEVFSIHCFHDGKEYRIQLDKIDVTEEKTRKNRKQYMESIAKAYIRNLEQLIIKYPSQWFNFYDYWKEGK